MGQFKKATVIAAKLAEVSLNLVQFRKDVLNRQLYFKELFPGRSRY